MTSRGNIPSTGLRAALWSLAVAAALIAGPVAAATASEQVSAAPPLDRLVAEIGERWQAIRAEDGQPWEAPHHRVFDRREQASCGVAEPVGVPFYCDDARTLWLGTAFFQAVTEHVDDPVVAEHVSATVIAHEMGHHLQRIDGTSARQAAAVAAASSEAERNVLSQRLELQADCLAGVWAHFAEAELAAPLRDGLAEEVAVLARMNDADPAHTATHGGGDERMIWFGKGRDSGDPSNCDTFAGSLP